MGEFCCRQWCAQQSHPGVFKTPIHQAAHMGSFQCLKMFVRHSPSSVIARDGESKTPGNYASKNKNIACWKLLIASQFVYARIGGFSLATHARIMKWCHKAKQRVEYFRGGGGGIPIASSSSSTNAPTSFNTTTDDMDPLNSYNSHLLLLHSALGRESTSNTFLGNEIVVSGFNHGKLIKKCPCKHRSLERPLLSRRNTQNNKLLARRRHTRAIVNGENGPNKDNSSHNLNGQRSHTRPSINNEHQLEKDGNEILERRRRHTRSNIDTRKNSTSKNQNNLLVQNSKDKDSMVIERRHTKAVIETHKVLPTIHHKLISKGNYAYIPCADF